MLNGLDTVCEQLEPLELFDTNATQVVSGVVYLFFKRDTRPANEKTIELFTCNLSHIYAL